VGHRIVIAARCPTFVVNRKYFIFNISRNCWDLNFMVTHLLPLMLIIHLMYSKYFSNSVRNFLEFSFDISLVYKDFDDVELEKLLKKQFLDELWSFTLFHKLPRLHSVCDQYKVHKK
jgi:hypothetical protein